MQETTKRDLRKLFELLKNRRPLWDKEDEQFYRAETVSDLWFEVFQEMNKRENEVKSLILQLRGLLRVKKHKRMSKVKAYFRIGSPDWRNVTYLKDVENLQSIPSLDIDEDSDSIHSMSTKTTDIDADTDADVKSVIGDPAVGSPAVVGVPAVSASNAIDMLFGDMNVDNVAIGGPGQIDPAKVNPVKIDGVVVDPENVDNRAVVDLAANNPFEVDPNDKDSANYFWVDYELLKDALADDETINFELANGESAKDDRVNLDGTYGEVADDVRIDNGLMNDQFAAGVRIPYELSDGQPFDFECVDHDSDSAELCWSDSSSGFSDCGLRGVCPGHQEFNCREDINYDFFLTTLRNRLEKLETSARLAAASDIFILLQKFESRCRSVGDKN